MSPEPFDDLAIRRAFFAAMNTTRWRVARRLWGCEFDGGLKLTKTQALEIGTIVAGLLEASDA
jgi:hypothetical protein